MYFFKNVYWAAVGPASFIIINYISYKKDLIKVMERDEPDGLGTVYYAVSLFLMVIYTFGIINKPEIGLCGTLIMGYGDGLASVIGQSIKSYEYKIGNTTKTIAGSFTMLVISGILVSVYLLSLGTPFWYFKALGIAIILTIIEAVSIKGTDNLTVPITACLLLSLI